MALTKLGLRHQLRELQELGVGGSAFRIAWELKRRSRFFEVVDRAPVHDEPTAGALERAPSTWRDRLWFTAPEVVRDQMGSMLDQDAHARLCEEARSATRGRIVSFSHEVRDYGHPIDWHRDPVTGQDVPADLHWTRAMASVRGDVKDLWEVGRFPHAYAMGRAAAYHPELRDELGRALVEQIESFLEQNPFGRGVHWASGQEIAFRLFAWTFALPTLLFDVADDAFLARLAGHVHDAGVHIARHVDYARKATYNNHLLSEAAALMLVAFLLPGSTASPSFADRGRELFDEGVRRQFYADGGYIQQAHNYHRVALQDLVWAVSILRASGESVTSAWRDAGLRSVEFLQAQQAPNGSLPNYGNNDGALVSPLTSCSYDDFRSVLQAVSVELRDERCFEPGPWDEEALWFSGPLPRGVPAPARARSRSFRTTGHHVLRGDDPGTFALFRCGTLLDRFTQMDMLHVDVFWRGHNVVVDPGSYRYNGAPAWNAHFLGTASHNTIVVDGENQMVHVRQFKMLYPAEARLLRFHDDGEWTLCAGEHDGYRRLPGEVRHRRSVLRLPGELWVVVDTINGQGEHDIRLHWLLGPYPQESPSSVQTEAGTFELVIFDGQGEEQDPTVVTGVADPPRGWLSRRYAHKQPTPSLVVQRSAELPLQLVTVLGPAPVFAKKEAEGWYVCSAEGEARFDLVDGIPSGVNVGAVSPPSATPE